MKRSRRFVLLLAPLAALAGACTSFTTSERTGDVTPAITGLTPGAPVTPGGTDAGAGSPPLAGGDAAVGPGACTASTFTETFPTATFSTVWGPPEVANGGEIGLGPKASSPPLALVANGVFPETGAGRARVQRVFTLEQGGQAADLRYALSLGTLPSDVTFDLGCTLELSRADGTTARARLSDRTASGADPSGLVATVDATRNGVPDPAVIAPPAQVLSNQLSTVVWYTVHIGATFDATQAYFSFDLTSDLVSGHLDPIAVPFAGITGVTVSCGVDDAVRAPAYANETAYQVLIDDVTVTACAR